MGTTVWAEGPEVIERLARIRWPLDWRPSEGVLFDAADVERLRARARSRPGVIDALTTRGDALLRTNPDDPNVLQPYIGAAEALAMAECGLITQGDPYYTWAARRVTALLGLESWFLAVHARICRGFDHGMANVAARVALAADHLMLAGFDARELRAHAATELREKILLPFLTATGSNPEWWARPETVSNWKIMTHGDAGTAIIAFADSWPEAPEALTRAARGVIETLDQVPPEGDWGEGVGYWFATLQMGLRFATALRRATRGSVDLLRHPALAVTGDFAMMLTSPSPERPRIYNFNDNPPDLNGAATEALLMLATEHDRSDWRHVARSFGFMSPYALLIDDPAAASSIPTNRLASFPSSGVATMRTGWDPRSSVFVGMKSGPSTGGHSHLDANSFIVEAFGAPLVIDPGAWPEGEFLGFFTPRDTDGGQGPRWRFDALSTIGHSTLLVDGSGQSYGEHAAGRIAMHGHVEDATVLVGDASRCYPGLLRAFVRTIALLPPDQIVIRDVVECDEARSVEWLLHYAGTITSNGHVSTIDNRGVRLVITPFLPDRQFGWRVIDATRTSHYENSDTRRQEAVSVQYRSFSPFRPSTRFEFLFGLRVNGHIAGADWAFEHSEDMSAWELRSVGTDWVVGPEGDGLRLTRVSGPTVGNVTTIV